MLNKTTTSTGLILLGFSSFASANSASLTEDFNNSHQDLYAVEIMYNAPESIKSRIDSYVDFNYKMDENVANKYSLIDYGFMNAVQKFAEEQIELDSDFSSALEELFLSKINSNPSKKRF
jgi:hypothetical protein